MRSMNTLLVVTLAGLTSTEVEWHGGGTRSLLSISIGVFFPTECKEAHSRIPG